MRHAILSGPARLLVVAALASGSVAGVAQEGTTPLPPAACASLQGLSIPASAIGLQTSGAAVQTAVAVTASAQGNTNGDYCKVTGIVKPHNASSPNLEFEVNLPVAWNRRVLQMGGGGYNGTLVTGLGPFTLQPATVDNALKQGFVTLGTDGGHKSTQGFDGSFALDDEALRNFGKESVKKGHDVAFEIIKKAYGRAPERSVLHRRLAGRARGARRRRALSERLRRGRRSLSGVQRHAAPSRIAERRARAIRGRGSGVDQSHRAQGDHRRRVCEMR